MPEASQYRGASADQTFLQFPATRGNQAGREFYTTICDFDTVVSQFKFDTDPAIPPKMRAQRKIRSSRVPKIASYIYDNPDSYVFSAITVSVSKKVEFQPLPPNDSGSNAGVIKIPSGAIILVNDGQHRCSAIREACHRKPELGSEKIGVVMFEDRGLERSQQMFADLNMYAVKPTKSLGLLYNHRSEYDRFIVTLVDDVDIFHGRTEMERTNISNRSTNLFTLNGVSDATKYLLQLNTRSISPEKQKIAAEFWKRVAENIPEWNLIMEKKITPSELRKEYVHAHTNVLNALGLAGAKMIDRPDWREKIRGLQKIDWKKDSPLWKDKVVMDGKMLKNRLGIRRAANTILERLGVREVWR